MKTKKNKKRKRKRKKKKSKFTDSWNRTQNQELKINK